MSEEHVTALSEENAAPAVEETAPVTESMDDFKDELEKSFIQIYPGDVVEGTIIDVTESAVLVDLGYYTDGIIRLEDASDDPSFSLKDRLEVGQTIKASVVKRDDGEGHILLSTKEAAALVAWERLKELLATQENVTVRISDVTKSGVIAYLEGVRGFIPASKLSTAYVAEEDLPAYANKAIEVRVITANEEENRLVMSAREILREKEAEEKARKISNVEVGLVTEGVVETIKPYGAFVRLADGTDGLLHISQISQKRIKSPHAVLKEGQTVKVKIIGNKDGRLSLSMKALEDIMSEDVAEEVVELPEEHEVSTSLGSLLAGFKFE